MRCNVTVSKFPKPFSNKRFTGILAEPIDAPSSNTLHLLYKNSQEPAKSRTVEEWEQVRQRYISEQYNKRFDALYEHYYSEQVVHTDTKLVRDGNWKEALLFRLASDFVLGFKSRAQAEQSKLVRIKRGPDFDLVDQVEAMRKKGRSAKNACRLLVKDKTKAWHKREAKTVLEIYNTSKSRITKEQPASLFETQFAAWLNVQPELTQIKGT